MMDDLQPPCSEIDVKEKDPATEFCIYIYLIFFLKSVFWKQERTTVESQNDK